MLRNCIRALIVVFATAALCAPILSAAQSTAQVTGSATYQVSGSGASTLLLVPGLASDASVFDGVAAALRDRYRIVTLTLAGFGGVPAPKSVSLDDDVASLARIVAAQPGGRAIVVGHSLGGHLALRLAATHPELVRGLVILDSLPLFPPAQPGASMEQRRAAIEAFVAGIRSQDDAAYAQGEAQFMGAMVTDPKTANALTAMAMRCDRRAVADRLLQMSTTDLTPLLPKIAAPTLVLVPAPDAAQAPTMQALYAKAFSGTPHIDVRSVAGSRHFLMYDRPKVTIDAIAAFASGLT